MDLATPLHFLADDCTGFVLSFTRHPPLLRLIGDLDCASAPVLLEAMGQLEPGGTEVLTVCLADVGFVDASGIGALSLLHARCRAGGGELRITEASRRVARIFELGAADLLLSSTRVG